MQPGEIEYEFGVPIPGAVLPQADWARTGVKRLPEPGPLDWAACSAARRASSLTWAAEMVGSHSAVRLPGPIITTARSTNCPW